MGLIIKEKVHVNGWADGNDWSIIFFICIDADKQKQAVKTTLSFVKNNM